MKENNAQPAAPAKAAQTAAPATAAKETTATSIQPSKEDKAQATQAQASQQGGFGMFLPMIIIFAIFYFMMIRPQQRKEKERRKMIDELRSGATVLFANGFIGKITEAKEKTFMIEMAPNVVVEVARSAVQSVLNPDGTEISAKK